MLNSKNYLAGKLGNSFKLKNLLIFTLGFVLFFVALFYVFGHPLKNNKDRLIHVSMNEGLNKVAIELKNENIIRSEFIFRHLVSLFEPSKQIKEGDYFFARSSPIFVIAQQLAKGYHKVSPLKITLIEGYTNEQIANKLEKYLPSFNKDLFQEETKDKQGYLFPDTYFFYKLDSTDEVIKNLSINFSNHIKKINTELENSGKSLREIIIMASLIEKEASGPKDAPIISGILWKRLRLGMPLQVDADEETYKRKGLPEDPICNPGMVSIMATLDPQSSSYLYYLHDKNRNVHYAKTFTEHKRNIRLYLK